MGQSALRWCFGQAHGAVSALRCNQSRDMMAACMHAANMQQTFASLIAQTFATQVPCNLHASLDVGAWCARCGFSCICSASNMPNFLAVGGHWPHIYIYMQTCAHVCR